MANMANYFVIIVGLLLLFNAAGLPTASIKILDFLGINFFDGIEDITLSNFFLGVGGIFATIGIAGVAIGLFTGKDPTTFLLAGYAALAITFSADVFSIITYSLGHYDWEGYVVALILAPMAVGYVLLVLNWWSNRQ